MTEPDKVAMAEESRRAAEQSLERRQFSTASFFADKYVTLTGGLPDAVYLLVRCYFASGQYRRAVLALRHYGLLDPSSPRADLRFFLLAGQALAECEEWDEVLRLVGADEDTAVEALHLNEAAARKAARRKRGSASAAVPAAAAADEGVHDEDDDDHDESEKRTVRDAAAIAQLRGTVYDRLENRERAVKWLKHALRCDSGCVEAFDRLVSGRMLGQPEEAQLLRSLEFAAGQEWLRDLYRLKSDSFLASGRDLAPQIEELGRDLGLESDLDMQVALAQSFYARRDFRRCYDTTKGVIVSDPFRADVLPVHVCAMLELGMKSDLFYCAHQLVEAYPDRAVSWFSVGCYYLAVRKFALARTYFNKALGLDRHFAPAWIGFGNAFAAQDESDQALAAYRTAARLFEGSHLPPLFIGMEYVRTHNLQLAAQFYQRAQELHDRDPLVANEIGVLYYRQEQFEQAATHFRRALELAAGSGRAVQAVWEPSWFNLGHTLRRLGPSRYGEAIEAYKRARQLRPRSHTTDLAIGFTYHLMGQMNDAIQWYHRALVIQPRDTMATGLLDKAMARVARRAEADDGAVLL